MSNNTRQNQQKHPVHKANYVTSAPLVLAYALAGNVAIDLEEETFGYGETKVSIRDIWPSRQEIEHIEDEFVIRKIFQQFKEKIQVISTFYLSLTKKTKHYLDRKSSMEFIKNSIS